jgi:uncharacterized damage-inducible protein DinB
MTDFAATMTAMATLSDDDMARSWPWREGGEDFGVRDGFHRGFEAETGQAAAIEAAGGWSQPVAAMAAAQRALGQVMGLLAGQPDDLLDFQPGPDEWPLREVIQHMLETELSYLANVRWAVTRTDDQPVAMPPELRPSDSDAPADGGFSDVLARLEVARAATDAFVSALQDDQLERPCRWAGYSVDVRFRLYRFASHLAEHGIHAEKILRAAGREPAEARQMVRAIWAARGAHQRRSPADTIERLDREHAARLATFDLGAEPAHDA